MPQASSLTPFLLLLFVGTACAWTDPAEGTLDPLHRPALPKKVQTSYEQAGGLRPETVKRAVAPQYNSPPTSHTPSPISHLKQPTRLPIILTVYPLPEMPKEAGEAAPSINVESVEDVKTQKSDDSTETAPILNTVDSPKSLQPPASSSQPTLWRTLRPDAVSSGMVSTPPPTLPQNPPGRSNPPRNRNVVGSPSGNTGSQGGGSGSKFPTAPSTKAEDALKSPPKEPQGITDVPIPSVLIDGNANLDDNYGSGGGSGAENPLDEIPSDPLGVRDPNFQQNPDWDDSLSDRNESGGGSANPYRPGGSGNFGNSDNADDSSRSQGSFKGRESDSPWTESALMILATVSTLAFLCMLYIAEVYRRRWLTSLMSQNGILPGTVSSGTLPPFPGGYWTGPRNINSNDASLQDGFYEIPFSPRNEDSY